MNNTKKVILLDRDGVINEDPHGYISSAEKWYPIPGSLEAISKLNHAGWQVFVITNQSGIGRGFYALADMHEIHEKMQKQLAMVGGHIQDIFFCPHHPEENCQCRKPAPGLFYQVRDKYNINLADTFFVGDKISDVKAGQKVGCQPILVMTGCGKQTIKEHPNLNVPCFADLTAAVEFVLTR